MDVFYELKNKIRNHSKIDEKKVITDGVPSNGISKLKLRDYLMEIGTILEFEEQTNIFVAVINSGFANKNSAIVGLKLMNGMLYIVAYANEGFIHQGTAKKAIQKILSIIN